MEHETRRKQILKQMARIDCMEKGRLSEEYREQVRNGQLVRLGPYYKHQCWENGRNVSRRVPTPQVGDLRKAVEGYHQFEALSREYADLTIAMTRQEGQAVRKKKPR